MSGGRGGGGVASGGPGGGGGHTRGARGAPEDSRLKPGRIKYMGLALKFFHSYVYCWHLLPLSMPVALQMRLYVPMKDDTERFLF